MKKPPALQDAASVIASSQEIIIWLWVSVYLLVIKSSFHFGYQQVVFVL